MDNNLTAKKSDIKGIAELMRKISEQWEVLAQDFVDKTKRDAEEILLRNLSKMLVGLLVLNLNFKFVNKLRKSKVTKTLAKGLSFLGNMV